MYSVTLHHSILQTNDLIPAAFLCHHINYHHVVSHFKELNTLLSARHGQPAAGVDCLGDTSAGWSRTGADRGHHRGQLPAVQLPV